MTIYSQLIKNHQNKMFFISVGPHMNKHVLFLFFYIIPKKILPLYNLYQEKSMIGKHFVIKYKNVGSIQKH